MPAKVPKVLGLMEGGDTALEKTAQTVTESGAQHLVGNTVRNLWESGVQQPVEHTVQNLLESRAQQQAERTVLRHLETRVQQLVEDNVAVMEGRLRKLVKSSAAELECRLHTLVDSRVKKLEEESSAAVESRLPTLAGSRIEGRVQQLEERIGAEVERRLQTLEGRGVPQHLQEADSAALECRLQTQLETRVRRLVESGTDALERRLQTLVESRLKQLEERSAAAVDARLRTLAESRVESRVQQPTESSAADLGRTERGLTERTAEGVSLPVGVEDVLMPNEEDSTLWPEAAYCPHAAAPDTVPLAWSNLCCLAQDAWLSDTIVDFYTEYIQCRDSRERNGPSKFHVFSNFVYTKLFDSIHYEDGEVGKRSPPCVYFAVCCSVVEAC
jgi:uncharacterized FlaG/YvyC family protein